ncbi:hypothetical protein ERJ75_000963400 [Trypanosoma vivax]|nr:hypothetical protein TRVL_03180 [Trypanosoma vivax]KAH8611403.1 hypothetical protein ERJ75_000963400 [Trypanosoma vivax]
MWASRSSARISTACFVLPLCRQQYFYHGFHLAGFHGWRIPCDGKTKVTKEELDDIRFFTQKPKEKWDYHRVDENINSNSEFRKTHDRPMFSEGMREDNSTVNDGDLHTPKKYRLYEYFDEYTKPGVNKKIAACYAVKEQWDAAEFYYPGEAWQKNRPGFRSVPKELLNRQTWYHWSDTIMKWDEIQPTIRTRSWNPDWPPPGYKIPKRHCQKEFTFGVEDPAIVSEVERYNWFRSWGENNMRCGWKDIWLFGILFAALYYTARISLDVTVMRAMMSNMFYPGRQIVRSFGTPKDWEKDVFWWQRPLEEFPNQTDVWYFHESRFKYMDYIKKRDAREQALVEAEGHAM